MNRVVCSTAASLPSPSFSRPSKIPSPSLSLQGLPPATSARPLNALSSSPIPLPVLSPATHSEISIVH
jgi:hypothetical protein